MLSWILNFFPQELIALLVAFCSVFTGVMDFGEPTVTGEIELVSEQKLVFEDAMSAGQGLTTDGEYWYTSGSMTAVGFAVLAKWDVRTMERVAFNPDAIPHYLREQHNSDHIGGISYYNGKLYAAVENKEENHPCIITYDPDKLTVIDVYHLPNDFLPDGVPWCAVDGARGYLYVSPFSDVDAILVFDLDTMAFDHFLPLSETVTRIQGGEVYGDKLYLSYDAQNSNADQILTVDLGSGAVTSIATRTVPSAAGNEAEGLTVCPMPDGSLIHVLDYDKTVGVYLRSYRYTD